MGSRKAKDGSAADKKSITTSTRTGQGFGLHGAGEQMDAKDWGLWSQGWKS